MKVTITHDDGSYSEPENVHMVTITHDGNRYRFTRESDHQLYLNTDPWSLSIEPRAANAVLLGPQIVMVGGLVHYQSSFDKEE